MIQDLFNVDISEAICCGMQTDEAGLIRAMDIPGEAPYRVTDAELQGIQVLIEAEPQALSLRMKMLESALIGEAQRCGAQTVVAFASATTGYATLLRRTRWRQAGIDARLVTITGVTGGAMSEVPRRLGQAFSAFWNRQHGSYPPGTTVEPLR